MAAKVRWWKGEGDGGTEGDGEDLLRESLRSETNMVVEPGPQADVHGEVVVTGPQVQEQEGMGQVPVPQAQTVEEKVEVPQVQMQERIVEVPQTQTVEKTMEVPPVQQQMIQQQITQQVIQQPASEAGEVKVMLKEMMSKIEVLEDKVNRLLKEKLGAREVEMVDMGVDRRRVGKMEVEQGKGDEQEQRAAQLTLEEAVEGGLVVKGRVDRWFGDRGYGFVKVKGKSMFLPHGEGCWEDEYGNGRGRMGEGDQGLVEGG